MPDSLKLQNFLKTCIHPLGCQNHQDGELFNIYNGKISGSTVNVNKSIDIGTRQKTEFQESLPDGFRCKIKKKVVTMKDTDKSTGKKKNAEVYNTDVIFSRVVYLLSAGRIQLEDLFRYELAPVPTALFKDTCEGRYLTNKADLKIH